MLTGRCVDVPYLGKGKLPNGVRVVPLPRERMALVLVWPGAENSDPAPRRRSAQPVTNPTKRVASAKWSPAITHSCMKT